MLVAPRRTRLPLTVLYQVSLSVPFGTAAKWKLAQIVVARLSVRAEGPPFLPLITTLSTTPSTGAASVALRAAGVTTFAAKAGVSVTL